VWPEDVPEYVLTGASEAIAPPPPPPMKEDTQPKLRGAHLKLVE
jgi:hypothetical protein